MPKPPMISQVKGLCQYKGCEQPAQEIASGRGHYGVGLYCSDHASKVADEGCPEYNQSCPNCGCLFGVG